jgi:hypothetical protein
MSRKLFVTLFIIVFSGFISAQTVEVTVTEGYGSVNHTRPGITDWIDCVGEVSPWPAGEDIVFNRKAGVEELIVLEMIGTTDPDGNPLIIRWHDDDNTDNRSWTDGTPTTEATNQHKSWFVRGVENGFRFTVPAGTDNRRLHLYLNNWYSTCVLTANTSDGALYISEAFYSEGWTLDMYGVPRHFIIDFQATSDNETLVVTWIITEEFGHLYGTGFYGAVGVAAAELIVTPALDVDEPSIVIPERFRLSQNYPNPFNPTTMIQYDLPEATQVTIAVYDLMGRAVKTLVDEFKDAGYHTVTWDARDDEGNRMSGGVYLYSIQAGTYHKTQKMVLLK